MHSRLPDLISHCFNRLATDRIARWIGDVESVGGLCSFGCNLCSSHRKTVLSEYSRHVSEKSRSVVSTELQSHSVVAPSRDCCFKAKDYSLSFSFGAHRIAVYVSDVVLLQDSGHVNMIQLNEREVDRLVIS